MPGGMSRRAKDFQLGLFVGAVLAVLLGHNDGAMEDRTIYAENAHGVVAQTSGNVDHGGLGEEVSFAFNGELDLAAEVIGVLLVRGEEANELIGVVMLVLGEHRITGSSMGVPSGVHLESAGANIAVHPENAVCKLIIESLEFAVHSRTKGVLYEEFAVLAALVVIVYHNN